MEVRLYIDDKYLDDLKKRSRVEKTADLIREGLALLDWATEEATQNRVVFSAEPNGEKPVKIESHILRQARLVNQPA